MTTYLGETQLNALGDPSRRAIVAILSRSAPLAVARIAEQLPISRPAVSQHLRVLKAAGLVKDISAGTRRLYSLDTAGLDDLRGYFMTFWRADLADFAAHVRSTLAEASDER